MGVAPYRVLRFPPAALTLSIGPLVLSLIFPPPPPAEHPSSFLLFLSLPFVRAFSRSSSCAPVARTTLRYAAVLAWL